jgi:hypothetical protein
MKKLDTPSGKSKVGANSRLLLTHHATQTPVQKSKVFLVFGIAPDQKKSI